MQKFGQYMKRGDFFVAWSLATPGHKFGDWSLVSIQEGIQSSGRFVRVEFEQALTDSEIVHIKSLPYMWAGFKIRDEPWALIRCRPGFAQVVSIIPECVNQNPLHATGV